MNATSLELMKLHDLRKLRAQQFTALIIREIDDLLHPETDVSEIHYRILSMMHANGAAWTTEEERLKFGFEPRDDLGWTQTEKQKLESAAMERMLSIANIISTQITES